jgi:glutamate racemase
MSAPIGVFDSGVGGLTVLKGLIAQMPARDFIYLGDTARLPYGTKSPQTIIRYALQAADALVACGVGAIVVACNTAASVGLGALRSRYPGLPVIGVIEPGAEAACAATRSGHIAVIGTERTIKEGAYDEAIRARLPGARVSARATPLLVSLAEEGLTTGAIAESIVHHYLDELLQVAGLAPDTLLLGCTHFPLLAQPIRTVAGASVRCVDSATTTAAAVRVQLEESAPAVTGRGGIRFLATDGAERFARVGGRFLERVILPGEVELIDL